MSMTLLREARAKARRTMPQKTSHPRVSNLSPIAGGTAFSINFIRHDTLPLPVRRTLTYCAFGYLGLQMAVLVMLLGTAVSFRAQSARLQTQLQAQTPSSDVLKLTRQEMAELRKRSTEELTQLQAMVSLQRQRFPIAKKLAAITTTLPARTWVTRLSGDRDGRTLTIDAAYLIDRDHPYELPTSGWIETLKATPAFGSHVKRLDLTTSSRKTQGSAELFTFQLVAEWQDVAERYQR